MIQAPFMMDFFKLKHKTYHSQHFSQDNNLRNNILCSYDLNQNSHVREGNYILFTYAQWMKEVLKDLSLRIQAVIGLMTDPFERGKELCQGADGTPTTQIDKLAENTVLSYLEENGVELNVLSEEIGFVDRGAAKTLVLDPIDGTYNSIMGVPLYTVSMAIGTERLRDIEIAYIRNLVTDDVYYAAKDQGAYLNGLRVHGCTYKSLQDLVMIMYLGNGVHPDTFRLVKSVRRTRAYGCASIEMCLVGTGAVDAFIMNSEDYSKRIRVVDIAASHLFLREAGGEIFDLDGKPLDMGFNLEERSNFLAVGDPLLKEEIL